MDGLNNALREFFAWTAWGMEKPPAYGAFHLTFTFVGLALSIFAAYKLRKLGDKGNRALLLGCGIFLLICEIYKQLFSSRARCSRLCTIL